HIVEDQGGVLDFEIGMLGRHGGGLGIFGRRKRRGRRHRNTAGHTPNRALSSRRAREFLHKSPSFGSGKGAKSGPCGEGESAFSGNLPDRKIVVAKQEPPVDGWVQRNAEWPRGEALPGVS